MTISGGWGNNWGGGPWGDGFGPLAAPAPGFYLTGARATTSRSFQVTFSEDPKFVSPLAADDASNLANWTLTRLDTLEVISLLTVRLVTGHSDTIEFVIVGEFVSQVVTYRITGANIISTTVDPLIDPKSADFIGMPAAKPTALPSQLQVDIRNPQTEGTQLNGALIVTTAGDYELEGGDALLRKLILRRLTTMPGEFYHLSDRDYGLGLKTKAPLVSTDLVSLKAIIEAQVAREPEVRSVSATLVLDSNKLEIRLKVAKVRGGNDLDFSVPIQSSQGVTL